MRKIVLFTFTGCVFFSVAPYIPSLVAFLLGSYIVVVSVAVTIFMIRVLVITTTTGDTIEQQKRRVTGLRSGVYGYRGKSL